MSKDKTIVVKRSDKDPDDPGELLELTATMKDMSIRAEEAISCAKVRQVMDTTAMGTFFSHLVCRLKYRESWYAETAETDGIHLTYNPSYVCQLTDGQLKGLLAHEVMHCAMKHFTRCHGPLNVKWNLAADLAINPLLLESGYELPEGLLIPGKGDFSGFETGLSTEEYYHLIPDDIADKYSNSADPGGCGGVGHGDSSGGAGYDDSTANRLASEWTSNVAEASQAAARSKRGEISAGMRKFIDKLLAPAVNWKAALREFFTRQSKRNYNWKRANRRYASRGLMLPTMHSLSMGHVVAMVDGSGSLDSIEARRRFGSELVDIMGCGVERVTILYHDVDVHAVQEWSAGDTVDFDFRGGGGTSHVPAFEWVEENCPEPPDVIVALTDCYTEYPAIAPQCPVLWAVVQNNQPHVPFGTTMLVPMVG